MNTIEEFTSYFLQITNTRVNWESKYNRNYTEIQKMINDGWNIDELKREVDSFASANPNRICNIYNIADIIPKNQPQRNLIKDIYCYHNDLRLPIPPAKIKILDSGEIIRTSPDIVIGMKESYTIHDALNYYYKVTKQTPTITVLRRDEGKFTYLLKEFDIDEILFAIDIAVNAKKQTGRQLRDLFQIQDYIEQAKNAIKRKRNQERLLNMGEN